MSAIATREAKKYSVPLHAASMRDLVSEIPKRSKRSVYERNTETELRRTKILEKIQLTA